MLRDVSARVRAISWRQLWHDPFTPFVLSLFGLMLGPLLAALAPPVLYDLSMTYIICMLAMVVIGFALQARWWLTWMVGTLIWSMGWLVVCLWHLSQLVER